MMGTRFRRAWHTVFACLVAMGIVLVIIYPYRPMTGTGWLLLALLALPFVLGLEDVGTHGLKHAWMVRRGRVARIAASVVAVIGFGIVLTVCWERVKPGLGTW
jgi:hypothetical protein